MTGPSSGDRPAEETCDSCGHEHWTAGPCRYLCQCARFRPRPATPPAVRTGDDDEADVAGSPSAGAKTLTGLRWVVVIRNVGEPDDVIGPFTSKARADRLADQLDDEIEAGGSHSLAYTQRLTPARQWRNHR